MPPPIPEWINRRVVNICLSLFTFVFPSTSSSTELDKEPGYVSSECRDPKSPLLPFVNWNPFNEFLNLSTIFVSKMEVKIVSTARVALSIKCVEVLKQNLKYTKYLVNVPPWKPYSFNYIILYPLKYVNVLSKL